jgi:hypothetical protein
MALSSPENSTNVRRESPLDPWPLRAARPSCAPAVMLVAWTAFVALAGIEEVFARLEIEAFSALALFVAAFAPIASRVDADAAALLRGVQRPLVPALVLDALLLALPTAAAMAQTSWTGLPGALVALVVLPLALVLHVEALRRPRVRKAPGASPAARRAAT